MSADPNTYARELVNMLLRAVGAERLRFPAAAGQLLRAAGGVSRADPQVQNPQCDADHAALLRDRPHLRSRERETHRGAAALLSVAGAGP